MEPEDAELGDAELGGVGLRGAAGAVTAGSEALATEPPPEAAVPPAGVPAAVVDAGAGGGAVPTPNSDGDVLGDDGSGSGVVSAMCCALVRSATSESVSFFKASGSGDVGFGGTWSMFGYGWSAPGAGGRSCAILPPSARCHQVAGFQLKLEQPVSSPTERTSAAIRPAAGRHPDPNPGPHRNPGWHSGARARRGLIDPA